MIGLAKPAADHWIFSTLAADTDVAAAVGDRIYPTVAPEDSAYPLVIVSFLSGVPVIGVGAVKIFTNVIYTIFAACRGPSFESLEPIANAIDAALHGKSGSNAAGAVLFCQNSEELYLRDDIEGVAYHRLGGRYQLAAQRQ